MRLFTSRALMLRVLQNPVERQLSAFAEPTRRWIGAVGLAISVGIVYSLAARLSLALLTEPDGVAVFWPAAGVAAGVLIALGPGARLPVAAGAIGATILAHLLAGDGLSWATIVFALCNAVEAVLVAGLLQYYFGQAFSLGRLRYVLGLLAAAIIGTAVSGVGGTAGYVLLLGSTASVCHPDHLATLVHIRLAWNRHRGAGVDRACRCGPRSAAAW